MTLLARSLQRKGVIEYARGHITILDQGHLEHCACECYAMMQQEKLPLKIGVRFLGMLHMPMYYFHPRNQDTVQDVDGTELADIEAARAHADAVARELKFETDTFLDEELSR